MILLAVSEIIFSSHPRSTTAIQGSTTFGASERQLSLVKRYVQLMAALSLRECVTKLLRVYPHG